MAESAGKKDQTTAPPRPSLAQTLLGAAAAQLARKAAMSAGSAAVAAIGWPVILTVIVVLLLLIIVLLVVILVALTKASDDRDMLSYQCESRLGYSIGNTASLTTVPRLATTVSIAAAPTIWEVTALQPATTTPRTDTTTTTSPTAATATSTTSSTTTVNPYATMTIPESADDHTRACASALQQDGELVGAPRSDPGTTLGQHVAVLANQQVGLLAADGEGNLVGPTNDAFSAANLSRYVYYQATGGALTLPQDLTAQIAVGDRVDADAISPGDLVFFNFTPTDGPTAVMIAITPTLGVDANTLGQPIAVGLLPTGNVIVKRPLPPESYR